MKVESLTAGAVELAETLESALLGDDLTISSADLIRSRDLAQFLRNQTQTYTDIHRHLEFRMTQYEDRAAAALLALKDYARDLEADLGKIERNRVDNPDYGHVQRMVRFPYLGITEANRQAAILRLGEYETFAADALGWVSAPAGSLSAEEEAARQTVIALVAAVQNIDSRADAVALIATFE